MTLLSRHAFFRRKIESNYKSEKIDCSDISIVIPVKDNQKGVDCYLDTFFVSRFETSLPKEILIVDNNSQIPITISERFLNKEVNVRLMRCLKPGPAAARNMGAEHATGNWILFNDSDCIPTAMFLSGYLKADNGSLGYAGNVKSKGDDVLSKYYESQEILIPPKILEESGLECPQYLITANALVWKPAFERIGGFNECIEIAGGEDVDLGLRLSQIGKLEYAMNSVVLHNFDDGYVGFARRFMRYGKGNKIIERLWGVNMKPIPFAPVCKSTFNTVVAWFQYLFLKIGYTFVPKI